jgi:hypothetical protein
MPPSQWGEFLLVAKKRFEHMPVRKTGGNYHGKRR